MNKIYWKYIARFIVSLCLIFGALTFYVNWYMPHGEKIYTGDPVCSAGERGSCSESFKEDLITIEIPDWAKFIRNNGVGLFMILAIVSGVIYDHKVNGK